MVRRAWRATVHGVTKSRTQLSDLTSVSCFSSCPQSFPASGSFLRSQLFASGGRSVGASAIVLPMNIQGWFALGLTGLISLQSKGLWRAFASITIGMRQFFGTVQLSHPYTTPGKTIALTTQIFVSKVIPPLLNMLSRFVIAFFPKSKNHFISWLQPPSAVIL